MDAPWLPLWNQRDWVCQWDWFHVGKSNGSCSNCYFTVNFLLHIISYGTAIIQQVPWITQYCNKAFVLIVLNCSKRRVCKWCCVVSLLSNSFFWTKSWLNNETFLIVELKWNARRDFWIALTLILVKPISQSLDRPQWLLGCYFLHGFKGEPK